jgi:hypothetical protein
MFPDADVRPPFRLEVEPHLEVVVVRAVSAFDADADAADQLDECLRSLWGVACPARSLPRARHRTREVTSAKGADLQVLLADTARPSGHRPGGQGGVERDPPRREDLDGSCAQALWALDIMLLRACR